MGVIFEKENSNYTKQNVDYLLYKAAYQYPDIANIVYSKNENIVARIKGDVHRTGISIVNPYNYCWLTVEFVNKKTNNKLLNTIHIYVCFRILDGQCIREKSENIEIKN